MGILEEITKKNIIKEPPNAYIMKLFGMINTYPSDAYFATQNENEQVVMVIRKHIIKNFSWVITTIIALLAPLLIISVLTYWDSNFNEGQLLNNEVVLSINSGILNGLLYFYFLLILTYAYFGFIHWFYDAFIITNERFISIDFDILKGRTITDIPLADIIDVSEIVHGFFPSIFGYGTIEFKTISEKFISIENICYPTWFRDSFVDLIAFIRSKTDSPKDTELNREFADKIEAEVEAKVEEKVEKEMDEKKVAKVDEKVDEKSKADPIEKADKPTINNNRYIEP